MPRSLLLAALMMLVPATAAAQEPEPTVVYPERTELIIEQEVQVAGELLQPGVRLLTERRRRDFNPIISLRSDFDREMSESLDYVK